MPKTAAGYWPLCVQEERECVPSNHGWEGGGIHDVFNWQDSLDTAGFTGSTQMSGEQLTLESQGVKDEVFTTPHLLFI